MNETELTGSIFAGCKILEKLGQGGMGSVYKAEHLALGKIVCVKILSKELAHDQRNIEFFNREARSASKLDHPNIVHVYSFGEEKGLYFIVMSYVEGKSLEDIVKEKTRLPIPEAAELIIGILEGLAHAHSKNIIHRDIKPSNILVTKDNLPRIADFGLARSINEEKQLTIAGEMVGTAYFMSPEQGLAGKVDTRADLYAVGGTFFYLITGKYPFDGKSSIEVINKHINDSLPNLYQMMPDIPLWTVKVIEKLMRKNPQDRYQTAQETIEELNKYKNNDYKDLLQENEKSFDLEDLKKSSSKSESSAIAKERYEGYSLASEKSDRKKTTEEPPQIFTPRKQKFHFNFLHKAVKTLYHLSFILLAAVFSVIAGIYAAKGISENPVFINGLIQGLKTNIMHCSLFIFLALAAIFTSSRFKPFKITPLHLFTSVLMCALCFVGAFSAIYPENYDLHSKLFHCVSLAVSGIFSKESAIATVIGAAFLASLIYKSEAMPLRIFSSLLVAFSAIFAYSYAKWLVSFNQMEIIAEQNLLYAAWGISLAAIALNFFKKSFFIITPLTLVLSAAFLFLHSMSGSIGLKIAEQMNFNEQQRYDRELQIYEMKKNISTYEETGEYDEEGNAIMRPNPQKADLKAPERKAEDIINAEAGQKASNLLKEKAFKAMVKTPAPLTLAFFLFWILNVIFYKELIIYEKEFILQ